MYFCGSSFGGALPFGNITRLDNEKQLGERTRQLLSIPVQRNAKRKKGAGKISNLPVEKSQSCGTLILNQHLRQRMKSKALWLKSKQIRRNTGLTPEKEKTVQPRLRGYTVSLPKSILMEL